MSEHTTKILARELRKAGLEYMAREAEGGYYHDYLSPLATPCIQLATDLKEAGTPQALALLERHLNGEFDATKEEGDEWMDTEDGKQTLAHLPPGMHHLFMGKKP